MLAVGDKRIFEGIDDSVLEVLRFADGINLYTEYINALRVNLQQGGDPP